MLNMSQMTLNLEEYHLRQARISQGIEQDRARLAGRPELLRAMEEHYAEEMKKGAAALGVNDFGPSIPQDLDRTYRSLDAKNEGWGRCSLLKAVPKIQGFARTHEYAMQVRTGLGGTEGASSESSVGSALFPTQAKFTSTPRWVKNVYQRTRSADDVTIIGDLSESNTRLIHRRLVNGNLIWGDTRTRLNGTDGLTSKGIIQLIEEGTNGSNSSLGTDGWNYNGKGHIVDWKSQPVSTELARTIPDEVFNVWGSSGQLKMFMPSRAITGMESAQDGNRRNYGPFDSMFQGNVVTGITVNGKFIPFIPEDDLNPFSRDAFRGFYHTRRPTGYPTTLLTVTPAAQTEGTTDGYVYNLWDDNHFGSGSVRYVVTYFDADDRESLGSLSSAITVNSGQEAKITVSNIPVDATRIRVYRYDAEYGTLKGLSASADLACWVMDAVPTGSGAPTVIIDHNEQRPYCGTGLVLSLSSDMADLMSELAESGKGNLWKQALTERNLDNSAPFVTEEASLYNENTVREVYVGPQLAVNQLAISGDFRVHYLLSSWRSTEITNPFLCGIVKNIPLVKFTS